jgi:arabinogalactan endo-1,4-beta-galactosidase
MIFQTFKRSAKALRFGGAIALIVAANNAAAIQCAYTVSNDWGNGFTSNLTVTNNTSASINGWEVRWQQNGGSKVLSSWNTNLSGSNPYTATNVDWNAVIAPGASQSFGLQGDGDNSTATILGCNVKGATTSSRPAVSSAAFSSSRVSSSRVSSSPVSSAPVSSSARVSSAASSVVTERTEIVIEENTTGFCNVNGTIDNNNGGFTGSGFINSDNAVGAGATWRVKVRADENYILEWRYANASATNRPGRLLINGNAVATVDLPTTGAWNSWTIATANIGLKAGDNTIRLEGTTADGLGNIDSLKVVGNNPQPVECRSAPASSSTASTSSRASSAASTGVFKPDYVLGADITWTLEQESIGRNYRDDGKAKSLERILADHGFNFVRLRTFVCPTCTGGYTSNLYSGAGPTEAWADTAHTITMAKRVKACGMGVFLNFHLSDNWASIGHQERPSQWAGMTVAQIRTASYNYSKGVLDRMVAAGVKPDMVQCGNENDSRVSGYSFNDWAGFSGVMNSCIRAVRETDPNIKVVIQHGRPRPDGNFAPAWVDRMSGSNPAIDADVVCGSTYGTTNNGQDWRDQFSYVINKWNKPVLSCEYTDQRRDLINDVINDLPKNMGWGTFIWEPTAYSDKRPFDFSGRTYTTNASMDQYARIARENNLPVPTLPASQLDSTSCR